MTDLDALVESVVAAPADYAPRGVFADFLEERGDERHDTVRRAPDAQRAMAEFPEAAGRLASNVRADELITTDADGTGLPCFNLIGEQADEWPRIAIRLWPKSSHPILGGINYEAQEGWVNVFMRIGGVQIISLTASRGGLINYRAFPDPLILSGPLDIGLVGTGRLRLWLYMHPMPRRPH